MATVNHLACRGLDKLEEKLPILQQPSDTVLGPAGPWEPEMGDGGGRWGAGRALGAGDGRQKVHGVEAAFWGNSNQSQAAPPCYHWLLV